MTQLQVLKGREIIVAITKIGYSQIRQRGSHIRLECPGRKSITVPNHVVGRRLSLPAGRQVIEGEIPRISLDTG